MAEFGLPIPGPKDARHLVAFMHTYGQVTYRNARLLIVSWLHTLRPQGYGGWIKLQVGKYPDETLRYERYAWLLSQVIAALEAEGWIYDMRTDTLTLQWAPKELPPLERHFS